MEFFLLSRSFLFLFCLMVAACAPTPIEVPRQGVRQRVVCEDGKFRNADFLAGVVGGTAVGEESWIAHKVVLIAQESGEARSIFACTGTLIAPDIVLTAAHCVSGAAPSQTKVYFQRQPECEALAGKSVSLKARAFRIHPSYGLRQKDVGDLALLQLESKAPDSYGVVRLVQDPFEWEKIPSALVAGYGRNQPGPERNPYDVLNLRATTLSPAVEANFSGILSLNLRPETRAKITNIFATPQIEQEFLWINQQNGSGICSGDSGGPMFINRNGQSQQVGISFAVFQSSPLQSCQQFGVATNVWFHRVWLEKAFAELRGSTKTKLFSH